MITVVLDDDPTGTQAVSDVSVVLDWSDPGVWTAVEPGDRAVHVLTNSRAHAGGEAAELVASAAAAARSRFPGARLSCAATARCGRTCGRSTTRCARSSRRAADGVPLLLVPALPAAGRVTVGGVHMLERDGGRVPLHETEYARDGALAYSSADLRLWADERSGGRSGRGRRGRLRSSTTRRGGGRARRGRGARPPGGRRPRRRDRRPTSRRSPTACGPPRRTASP